MWVAKVIFFIFFTASCGAQGEALPVPSVHLQSQSEVFPSELVKLSCDLNSKDWTITWYRDEQEVRPSDSSVILSEESQNLTVKAVTQSQSGEYRCKGNSKTNASVSTTHSNAVQITVHGEKLKPTLSVSGNRQSIFVGETFSIRCLISALSSWEYIWYLNDNPIHKSTKDEYTVVSAEERHDGNYYCKVQRGGVAVSTDSDTINIKVSEVPIPTAKLLNVWPDVIENEEVSLHCETGGPDWMVTWFRDGVQVDPNPNIKFTEQGARLIITSALKSLQGRYTCKASHNTRHVSSGQSEPVKVRIHDTPKPTLSKSPNLNKMYVGETVTFTCDVLLSAGWTYKWSKDDADIGHTDRTLSIVLQLTNGGGYSCKAFRGRVVTSSSDKMTQAVNDVPVPVVKLHSSWSDVYKNEKVTLGCDAGSTDWRYSWIRNGQPLTEDDSLKITEQGSTLQIVSASMSHIGGYFCKAQHKIRIVNSKISQPLNVKVYEIPVPQLTPLISWLDVFPSETVELGCGVSSAPQDWTYQWHKDDQTDISGVSFDSDHAKLSISSASASHKGQYKCRATLKSRPVVTSFSAPRTLKVYDQKPQPTLVQQPDYSILFPQEPMKFHCQINVSSDWEFVWYKNGKQLQSKQSRYEVTSPDITHSGSYSCKGKRGKTHSFSTLMSQVKKVEIRKDIPEPVLSQRPDVDKVYLGELVMFECKLNISSDWEYHWLKNGQPISPISALYTVSATRLQSEVYRCKAKRRKTLFETESQSKVIHISEIPIPFMNNLTSWLDVFPTETVMLRCGMETGASDWFYTWSKDGQKITPENNINPDQNGSVLTILSSVSHTGEYSCRAIHKKRPVNSNYSSRIRLEVYDAKPKVTLQDLEFNIFYTEDSVHFNCGVNMSSGWEYIWFRNNQVIASGPNHTIKHASTSHSGEYKCGAKRGKGQAVFHTDHSRSVTIEVKERPSAVIHLLTGWSEVFSTDSLVLKCEAVNSEDEWEFEWFKGSQRIEQQPSEKHTVTPQNDPDQSQYTCKGKRSGRPDYTKTSEPLKTTNLLLKRRVLLSISGCVVFGLCAVFLGCIVLRVCRKPVVDQERPEEVDLFLSRAELTRHAPNPLAEYVTDEDMKDIAKEADQNGTISCESTVLPIMPKEDEATPSQSNNTTGNSEMISFKQ